mgnify:CR=1 FL=1
MKMQILTDILVVRRPDGTTFQVAGTKESLDLLCDLIQEIPKEIQGKGTLVEIDDDAIYTASDGREVLRVPHGNAVEIPDACHIDSKMPDQLGLLSFG